MKIAITYFSNLVKSKSQNLRNALVNLGVELLPFSSLSNADGALVYNIHGLSMPDIKLAAGLNKPIISLQEGMYAIGWQGTIDGMKKECNNANRLNVMQFVWSDLEKQNYIKTGKRPSLIEYYGNPEHDLLSQPIKFTRKNLGIPNKAFVIVHIDQYAHPRGGPNIEQMNQISKDIREISDINNVYVIQCLHPRDSQDKKIQVNGRIIVKPFTYPIFDLIKLADAAITVSSTEGITAAILNKPIIEYDISNSPERWDFVKHGVAFRAKSKQELVGIVKKLIDKDIILRPKIDYKKTYNVDGNSSKRVAENIIRHFRSQI